MERKLFSIVYGLLGQWGKASRPAKCQYSDLLVLLVLLWAVLHERPICWACRSRPLAEALGVEQLPSPATMSRRLRRLDCLNRLAQVHQSLSASQDRSVLLIDARPLEIGWHSKDSDAGFGRGAGHKAKGYKLFTIWDLYGDLLAWAVWPMQVDERAVARDLLKQVAGPGWLVGDSLYDAGPLYDLAGQRGLQLLVYRDADQGLGHRKQSPYRLRSIDLQKTDLGRKLLALRVRIEAFYGQQCTCPIGLHFLPAWVRRWRRVWLYVQAKLFLHAVWKQQKHRLVA